jgi:hypothetical protein
MSIWLGLRGSFSWYLVGAGAVDGNWIPAPKTLFPRWPFLFQIYCNVIFPPTSLSPTLFLPLSSSTKIVCAFLVSLICATFPPSVILFLFDKPNNIYTVYILNISCSLSLCNLLYPSYHPSLFVRSEYSPPSFFFNTFQVFEAVQCRTPFFWVLTSSLMVSLTVDP